ncbi:MAG: hypothetical protein JWQ09_5265 [Segetibacter sp.]|nr:hypothetical protein [Segetibacter sp.]
MNENLKSPNSKRLLVVVSFSFSIRFLYRTGMLYQLRQFVTPVIVITWNEQDLVKELKNDGFEVHVIPESRKGPEYLNVRKKIDYWFSRYALKSKYKKIQVKYLDQYLPSKSKLIRDLREFYNYCKSFVPGYTKNLFLKERQLLQTDTNFNEMLQLVDSLNIDAVFTPTPFHTQEDILLRAAKQRGKKMLTSILSFDNLTKRGWIPVDFDTYMVWNKYNYNEAQRIYPKAATGKNVFIVGAAQFDFYFKKDNLLSFQQWRELTGIPETNKKIILYAGGPGVLFPNECQYLKHLLEALNKNELEGDPMILFRCHPIDNVARWKEAVGEHPNLIYDISWTGKEKLQLTNITNEDIAKLCSTLAYTDVHINAISTMSVDGSAYKKPQVGPCYDEVNPAKVHLLQNMYMQEHFIPIIKTGGLLLAKSRKNYIDYINETLRNPEKFISKSNSIIEEIITYSDGKSTERTVQVIKENI